MTSKLPHLFKAVVLAALVFASAANTQPPTAPPVNQTPQAFERRVEKKFSAKFLVYLPDDYGKDVKKRWPLLLFLHGADARGTDVERIKAAGPPALVEASHSFPFVIVSPLCPADEWWDSRWEVETLDALLDHVLEKYAVDPNCVYLTGLSMGGSGTWRWAKEHPERFAAIAPVCGRASSSWAAQLKNVPAWIFHGAQDELVPVSESQKMADALRKVGGDARLTIYPGTGHDAWTQSYNDSKLYDWLLSHHRQPTANRELPTAN